MISPPPPIYNVELYRLDESKIFSWRKSKTIRKMLKIRQHYNPTTTERPAVVLFSFKIFEIIFARKNWRWLPSIHLLHQIYKEQKYVSIFTCYIKAYTREKIRVEWCGRKARDKLSENVFLFTGQLWRVAIYSHYYICCAWSSEIAVLLHSRPTFISLGFFLGAYKDFLVRGGGNTSLLSCYKHKYFAPRLNRVTLASQYKQMF